MQKRRLSWKYAAGLATVALVVGLASFIPLRGATISSTIYRMIMLSSLPSGAAVDSTIRQVLCVDPVTFVSGPCNPFNSTNTNGNVVNNALVVNNPLGYGPLTPNIYGDIYTLFDATNGTAMQVMGDRAYYKVSTMPTSCSSTPSPAPAVVDATDAACTNAVAPAGGGTHECLVTCQSLVYKMNGAAPDGPMYISSTPSGNGFQWQIGPWNSAGLGSNNGGLITVGSHQASSQADVVQINYRLLLTGTTSGGVSLAAPAVAGATAVTMPLAPATTGMALTATTAGVQSYASMDGPSISLDGALGGLTSTAAPNLLQICDIAVRAGHFTSLNCVNDLNAGTCTTAPQFNVRNNTASTVGTALTCGTSAGPVTVAETLVFAAGATICIVRTANGATCTAPNFGVQAHTVFP